MQREVYSGRVKLDGEEHKNDPHSSQQLRELSLVGLERYQEAKSLMRKMMPVARRVLGESHDVTLRMRRTLAIGALLGHQRHAHRTPRGRDDARGGGTDRAARRWRANPLAGELGAICETRERRLLEFREAAGNFMKSRC